MTDLLDKALTVKELRAQLARRTLPLNDLLPHQIPPAGEWEGWIIQAGRGSGKTAGLAKYVTDHADGPPCIKGAMPHKMALIAPTVGDAVESADRHPICIRSLNPGGRLQVKPGGTIFTFPNGSEMKLFGVHTRDDVERLRAGGNNCLVWVEELAAWRYIEDGWDQMQFGLRIGPRPHWVGSSTPKNRAKFREIITDPKVAVTRAHTDDNPHLMPSFRERSGPHVRRYYESPPGDGRGTPGRSRRRPLEAVSGSMNTGSGRKGRSARSWSGSTRKAPPNPARPGSSPPVGQSVPAPAGRTSRGFRTRSSSRTPLLPPPRTGGRAEPIAVFELTEADRIAAERNFGGDMVEITLPHRLVVRPGEPRQRLEREGDQGGTRRSLVRAGPGTSCGSVPRVGG